MQQGLIKTIAAVALSAATCFANALGLGNIQVLSGLNEPLRAVVPLLSPGDLNPEQFKVQLADNALYSQRNLNRSDIHRDITIKVDWARAGGPAVLISSQRFIKEPSLDLLLIASWPQGQLERGYAVLLDHRQ